MMERPRPISGAEWSFRDVLLALTISFMALAVLALSVSATQKQTPPPGQLVVTLGWDQARDADVDLWVRGPGDQPVGYERRTGLVFDLLHDDRGRTVECAGEPPGCMDNNTEIAVARRLPPGLYIINAVAYQSWDHIYPIRVWVTVGRIDTATHLTTHLFRREGMLTDEHQEITLITFRLDEHGTVVPGSANDLPHPLWRIVE